MSLKAARRPADTDEMEEEGDGVSCGWLPLVELRLLLAAGEIDAEEFTRKRRDAQASCEHAGWVSGGVFTCFRCGAEFRADLDPPSLPAQLHQAG